MKLFVLFLVSTCFNSVFLPIRILGPSKGKVNKNHVGVFWGFSKWPCLKGFRMLGACLFHGVFSGPKHFLGGGFKYFLLSPLFGEDFHFDEHIFQRG